MTGQECNHEHHEYEIWMAGYPQPPGMLLSVDEKGGYAVPRHLH
jgi:hypothetical protein